MIRLPYTLGVLSMCVFMLLISSTSHAEIFVYTDANGALLLTDKPNMHSTRSSTGDKWINSAYHDYLAIIRQASVIYQVDEKLITAVINAESKFDSLAISRTGAMGLMQLMPDTANHLGVYDPFDPSDNINGGVKYLRYLIERFKGDLELAVAAYNAGPTNVEKYGKIPPFRETRQYVARVFEYYGGNRKINLNTSNTIQRVVMKDGSVLYTNQNYRTSLR